eukprot:3311710-Amphidinium_carterae.1
MAQETFVSPNEAHQIEEHEFADGIKMWSAGFCLHRQAAIAVSADMRQNVRTVCAWSHGVWLDCLMDAVETRLISAHLPNSWRPTEELAQALFALDEILADAAGQGKRIVLAGDLNVEMGALSDEQYIGSYCTQPESDHDSERAEMVYQRLHHWQMQAPTTFSQGLIACRANATTHHHWTFDQSKTLDYICISQGLIAHRTGDKLIDYNISDHDCIETAIKVSGGVSAVCPYTIWRIPADWEPPKEFATILAANLAELPQNSLEDIATNAVS